MNRCAYCNEPLLDEDMVKVGNDSFHWECFFILGEALRKAEEAEKTKPKK